MERASFLWALCGDVTKTCFPYQEKLLSKMFVIQQRREKGTKITPQNQSMLYPEKKGDSNEYKVEHVGV